ncbi:DUF6233 domain-containing protein [Streptomyces lasiicapitis]|uniref:DUF6233 domain-containing protein n=1 Tax=Streptomyces lasiicapitis TaxID=1923961 RepID=UPI00333360FB
MTESHPPLDDLAALRFLERVQVRDLARTRRWIADAERREAERARGVAARPPAPEWVIEAGISGRQSTYVHVGDCWSIRRGKAASREEARHALNVGVNACPQCRPDTQLQMLD